MSADNMIEVKDHLDRGVQLSLVDVPGAKEGLKALKCLRLSGPDGVIHLNRDGHHELMSALTLFDLPVEDKHE